MANILVKNLTMPRIRQTFVLYRFNGTFFPFNPMARKGGADLHDTAGDAGGESWDTSAEAAALRASCNIPERVQVVDQQAVFRGKLTAAITKLRRRNDMRPEGEGAASWLLNELHRDMADVRADVMRTVIGERWADVEPLASETAATRLMDYYATAVDRATRSPQEDGGGKKKKKPKGPDTTGLSDDPLKGAILGILMEIEDAGVDPTTVAAARRSILQLGDALAMPASRGPVVSNLRKLASRSKNSKQITELINALAW